MWTQSTASEILHHLTAGFFHQMEHTCHKAKQNTIANWAVDLTDGLTECILCHCLTHHHLNTAKT